MADDADFTPRANPFSRSTDHRKLDSMLDEWARWVQSGGLDEFHVGAAKFWAHGNSDVESLEQWADNKDATTMDACIWDLVPIERAAVSHYHIGAVWRTNRAKTIEEVYLDARLSLSEGLRRRRVD